MLQTASQTKLLML